MRAASGPCAIRGEVEAGLDAGLLSHVSREIFRPLVKKISRPGSAYLPSPPLQYTGTSIYIYIYIYNCTVQASTIQSPRGFDLMINSNTRCSRDSVHSTVEHSTLLPLISVA
jgi:hypothetical protein